MMMVKRLIIILLLGTGVNSFSIPFISDVMDMINLVQDISDLVTGQHDLTNGNLFKKKTNPALEAVNKLSEQIEQLSNVINVKLDKLMTKILKDLPMSIQYANLMTTLIEYVTRIDELYDDYQFYVGKFGNMSRYTLEDFSNVVTSHKYGDIPDILRQIYHLFVPGQLGQRDESLLDSMIATLNGVSVAERCNQVKTSQQQLFSLYETVIMTEIKGFTMATYAYGLLAIYHNTSLDNEIHKVTVRTILRCTQYINVVKEYLSKTGQQLITCDPPKHIEGKTYVQLNAIQKQLNYESDTSIVAFSFREQLTDYENNMVVTGARFVEKDRMIHVQIEQGKLLANGQIDEKSIKWKELEDFEYINEEDGERIEKIGKYYDRTEMVEGVDYLYITEELRAIDLDSLVTDRPNHVMIGLKMTQDFNISKAVQLKIMGMQADVISGTLNKNHYFWYSYEQFRPIVFLYNRFIPIIRERTKIDVENKKSGALFYDNLPISPDYSIIQFEKSETREGPNKVIVPFIDIQPVMSYPRIPLIGVNIYHRGGGDSGGFLSLRIKTFNIAEFLNTEVTQDIEQMLQSNTSTVSDIDNPNESEE